MLHYTRLERLARDKHVLLFASLVENSVVFTTLRFLRMGPKSRCYNTRLKRLARDKHSSLLYLLVSNEDNKCC